MKELSLWRCAVTAAPGAAEQLTQIDMSAAFDSPDMLQRCVSEVREMAAERSSTAACALVPKSCIKYPQVRLPLASLVAPLHQ